MNKFKTYEFANYLTGHVPPDLVSTSILSFACVMFNGRKPSNYAANLVFEKFQYFGVKKIVLRGGISANPLYIPESMGGKSKFKLAGAKIEESELSHRHLFNYLDFLLDAVSSGYLKETVIAIEFLNEIFWLPNEIINDWIAGFSNLSSLFNSPVGLSEPDFVTPTKPEINNFLTKHNMYLAYQLHKNTKNSVNLDCNSYYAIGEDYRNTKSELFTNALYHAEA